MTNPPESSILISALPGAFGTSLSHDPSSAIFKFGRKDNNSLISFSKRACTWRFQYRVWIPFLFILLSAILIAHIFRYAIADDAFIYLRVANNLTQEFEWSYNKGEVVNPCSGPLYVLILSLLLIFKIPGETALVVSSAIALAGSGIALYFILRATGPAYAAAAVTTYLTSWTLVASGGLEVTWFLFIIIVIWIAFSVSIFDTAIPTSVAVKSQQSHIGFWAMQTSYFADFFSQSRFPYLLWALALTGFVSMASHTGGVTGAPSFILIVYGLVQTIAYSIAGAPVGYFWYRAPGVVSLNLLAAFGIVKLYFWSRRLFDGKSAPVPVLILLGILAGLSMRIIGADSKIQPYMHYRFSDDYRELGKWLFKNSSETDTLAANEIGYLGYYSNRRILDMHGLIHPDKAGSIKQQEHWWFKEPLPTHIVRHVPPHYGQPSQAWPDAVWRKFQKNYTLAAEHGGIQLYSLDPMSLQR